MVSDRTRRFAKWSAICSFALSMAGQVAYHLLAQAGMARAPRPITTLVSCLPVLVLAMGTALAHMLRADTDATGTPGSRTRPSDILRSPVLVPGPKDQGGPNRRRPGLTGNGPRGRTRTVPGQDRNTAMRARDLACGPPDRRWIRPA
jgi:hypothetical protein